MNGAELIANVLAELNVRSVFSVAGASHAHLLNAINYGGLRIISSRHESGCVSAADGYARTRRSLGVALIVGDQGLPNALGGLASAFAANSPVLLLVALPPEGLLEARAFHEQKKMQLVEPISKYSRLITADLSLHDELDRAIHAALTGRPGPVVLALPTNLVSAEYADNLQPVCFKPVTSPAPISTQLESAARLLQASERPLVIAGAGAHWGDARDGLIRLNKEFDLPIVANGIGRGIVPEDWTTSFSWPFAQLAAGTADCVMLVGARLTQRLGFGLPPRFNAEAKFIQVDIHADEAHRARPVDEFIHADAGAAISAIADKMSAMTASPQTRGLWLQQALEPRFDALESLDVKSPSGPGIHPLQLGREIAKRMPPDSIYVGDGADIQSWMYGAIAIRHAPGFIDHYPSGSMGIGTPLAVGAAVAASDTATERSQPSEPTVLVTGDGSFGFQPAELHAAALAGLNLVVIIGNDGAWGTEVHDQQHTIGTAINTRLGQLPYERVAEGFGCTGLRVDSQNELGPILDRAFATTGPVVVNVMINPAANATLKTDDRLRMILFSDAPAPD